MAFIDPVGKYCFKIEIAGITAAHFMAATGISMEIEVISHVEGGLPDRVHMLPGQGKQGAVTLKRGYVVADGFYDWMKDAAGLANSTVEIRRQVHLILCSADMRELRRWSLEKAWPKKWALDDLDASGAAIAVESLELAHFGFLPAGAARNIVEPRRGTQSDQIGSAASGGGQSSGGGAGSAGGAGSSAASASSGPQAYSQAVERAARDAAAAASGDVPWPTEEAELTPQRSRPISSLERAWHNAEKLSPVSDAASFAQAQMDAGARVEPAEFAAAPASDGRRNTGLIRTPIRANDGVRRWSDGVDAVQPPVLDGWHHLGSVFTPRIA